MKEVGYPLRLSDMRTSAGKFGGGKHTLFPFVVV